VPRRPWLSLPVLLFLAVTLIYPLIRILALGFGRGLAEVLASPFYWGRLLWSLEFALGSSFLTLALGLGLGYLFRYAFPGRGVLLAFSMIPFVLPSLVVALAFLALLGPQGWLGLDLFGSPYLLFWASAFYNLGLVLRLLLTLLAQLETYLSAARTLGASSLRAYFRIGIPLLAPALLSSGSLVFLYSFSSLSLPLLLGGQRYATLEVEIYTALADELAFHTATALVLLQLFILSGILSLYLYLQVRQTRSLRPAPLRQLPRGRAWLLSGVVWFFFGLFYSPLIALVLRAFKHPQGFVWIWTSSNYTPAAQALGHTLEFTALALLGVLPLGVLSALAVGRGHPLELIFLAPLLVSPVALGLGVLVSYPSWEGKLVLLLGAYALEAYPLLFRSLLPALRSLSPSLDEAARLLGASWGRRLLRLQGPLVLPALRSGLALSAATMMGEFGATLVLQRPEWITLPLAIYERLGHPGEHPFIEALALAVLLSAISGGVVYVLDQGKGLLG